jgi:hypothetical protein
VREEQTVEISLITLVDFLLDLPPEWHRQYNKEDNSHDCGI